MAKVTADERKAVLDKAKQLLDEGKPLIGVVCFLRCNLGWTIKEFYNSYIWENYVKETTIRDHRNATIPSS